MIGARCADLIAEAATTQQRTPVDALPDDLDPDSLTPRQALDALYQLKNLSRQS